MFFEAPCIIEAVPTPASLTKAARLIPINAIETRAPIPPPTPALTVSASLKIAPNTPGTSLRWVRMMYITKRKYITTIAGTTLVATFEILLIPPRTTQATITVMITPIMNLSVRVFCSGVKKIEVIASVNWLLCIMQRVPIRPEIAKNTARGFHLGPNPDKIIYIGPP